MAVEIYLDTIRDSDGVTMASMAWSDLLGMNKMGTQLNEHMKQSSWPRCGLCDSDPSVNVVQVFSNCYSEPF